MPSLKMFPLHLMLLLGFLSATPQGRAQNASTTAAGSAMTNSDVVALVGAGLSDEIVVAKIQAAPSIAFDLSVNGLTALKRARVSPAVIRMMISPHPPASSASPSTPIDGSPTGALGSSSATAVVQRCPNLTGHWYTSNAGGLSMDITESNCRIVSNNLDSRNGFHHMVRGEWDSGQYSFALSIARLDPQHCWSHLFGRATVTSPSTFNVDIIGSDGRCGMPTGYVEHGTFARQ